MKRILLVEDNLINQDVAKGILSALGCQVDVAANGQEALVKLEKQTYELIFMDCQMPVLDGYQATRQIRLREESLHQRGIPIIALTAHALIGDRERCLACGMNDYLAKPVRVVDLQRILAQWLPQACPPSSPPQGDISKQQGMIGDSTMSIDSSSSAENVLDSHKVAEVQKIMGERFGLVVERFSQNGTKLCASLLPSLEGQDWEAIKTTVHTLKGSSGNLGAMELYNRCFRMEKWLAQGEYSKVDAAQIHSLQNEFTIAVTQLRHLV